jgi:NitT/TauT family transport system ATP-binding protein
VQLCLEAGRSYCLMGPSGQGKTTLLRILMGLEQPDAGRISGIARQRISAVFQEDRLCEYLDSVDNIRIACGKLVSRRMAEDVCCQLLEEEAVHRPVRELSGGMKRRAAIARALLSASDVILMDEPFAGLDQETKRQTIRRIRENLGGRTLLVVTHCEEDAVLLGAEILRLQDE